MKLFVYAGLILLVILAVIIIIVAAMEPAVPHQSFITKFMKRYFGTNNPNETEPSHEQLYTCPMHPTYISDKPGKCPICGMDLVPIKSRSDAKPISDAVPGYTTIAISPEKQQLIGVRKGEVKKMPLAKTIRATGTIGYNERRMHNFNVKFAGWIEEVNNSALTGRFVAKNTSLFSIYSPDLIVAQQEYLVALAAAKKLQENKSPSSSNIEQLLSAAKQKLLSWDITEEQIKSLAKENKSSRTLWMSAPAEGFIVDDELTTGKYIQPGETVFKIVDLSVLWVNAEVYEYELPYLRIDETAEIELSAFPGETFSGKVSYIYPYVNPATRTIKIRIEVENPEIRLKVDMYANVFLKVDLGNRLAIPAEAVMDSGLRQIVFVAKEDGHFEPREVKLGGKINDYFEVLKGLSEGEKIVTSGNFLIDSESRLKALIPASAPGRRTAQPENNGSGSHQHEGK